MNLVTKCPSCYTSFIVKPDQLKLHRGQVRCGQCQKVFIAAEHLNEKYTPAEFLNAPHKPTQKNTTMMAIMVVLVIFAIGQMIFFLRGDIAKHWPKSKPSLAAICHTLDCKIPLPQHADLLALDDTELIKDVTHNDVIQFNGVIINNAPYAQSFPSLELTLTDDQDMPVMRRKIAPSEYLNGLKTPLDEGIPGNDEIHVSIHLKTTDIAATGFRALVVY